ncbi:DUF4124 domain-containing protein [Pseudomaricurvus alkylphenolicus]|uniref:DUF4124 domain-containing protein n=1 Tax=Pseudomaricurvus alkylphenolicus TaxID=1306991 RepID=UPI00141E7DEE|nr:DUF4124 domain-containing protein [Pseudomaricurvus alkylphenolicus]NIB38722.1 DUF4124 domain-containing protein [Pseudomaricurvus alkylphenolicus]
MTYINALISLLLISQFASVATIYKWKDEHGTTHYGDHVPGNQEATAVKPNDLPHIHGSEAPKSIEFWKRPKNESNKRYTARTQRSRRSNKCGQYEQKIEAINSALRSGYKEPKGNKLRAKRRKYKDLLYEQCR